MMKNQGPGLTKAPTGILGLDELTGGGLPVGRATLVSGSAGAGKTMFGIEFIVRGAVEFNEPGVFMMFEENAQELAANVRSLGFTSCPFPVQPGFAHSHHRGKRRHCRGYGRLPYPVPLGQDSDPHPHFLYPLFC